MTRWLVTGAGGMLGRDIVAAADAAGHEVTALDRQALDIAAADAVRAAIIDNAPDVVVNCAAWTDVDGAEADEAAARRVNGDGPAHLAAACADRPVRVVHLSTDYVFRGDAATPYREDAETDPVSAYGRTKLLGEHAVLEGLPDSGYVLRTAWLYGATGKNFVRTMLRLEQQRDTVDVVDDQTGQPTWSADVAAQVVALVEVGAPPGVYHATSAGQTSWFGFAREIFRLAGADPQRVRPTDTAAMRRPAARPAYSVLDNTRLAACGVPPIRHWRDALAAAWPSIVAGA